MEGRTLTDFRRDFDWIVAGHGWSYHGKRGWRSGLIFDVNMRSARMAATVTPALIHSLADKWHAWIKSRSLNDWQHHVLGFLAIVRGGCPAHTITLTTEYHATTDRSSEPTNGA